MGKTMSVQVEPARPEDVAAVLEIEREVAQAPHWSEDVYQQIVASGGEGPQRRCLLVARLRDELVGFAAARVLADESELESIAVRADVRRMGAGRALCGTAIAWAWQQGAGEMILEVRASSAGAQALYRSLGFVTTGLRTGYYARPDEDAMLMRLERRDCIGSAARSV